MGAKHKASWTSSGFHTKRPEAANPLADNVHLCDASRNLRLCTYQ